MVISQPRRRWTYEDLFHLPDDGKRYEIIDGELYEMPPPGLRHQRILALLIELILPEGRKLGGRWFPSSTGVFLPPDERLLEPDLLVVLPGGGASYSERGIEGAPDLVVEVLSPSNPEHDRVDKRRWYAEAGVREYWIVSPEAAIIEVLALEGDLYRVHVRAGDDELVTSTVLPELSFPASEAFR